MVPYTWFFHTARPSGALREWRNGSELEAFFRMPLVSGEKSGLPGWSPFTFRNNRRANTNAVGTSLLVYDVDRPFVDLTAFSIQVREALGAGAITHTTFSAKPGALKARIVVRLARAITPEEFPLLWAYGRRALALRDVTVDDACKDAARLHYAPAMPPGGLYEVRFIEGAPLAAEKPIAYQRAILEAEHREREAKVARFDPKRIGHKGLEKIMRRAIDAVVSASEGERHRTLLTWTFRLSELPIDKVTVERAMRLAGCIACGDARRKEVERTVRYAIQKVGTK